MEKTIMVKLLALAFFVAAFQFAGCGKNDVSLNSTNGISDNDAADVVAASMGGSTASGGLSAQLKDGAEFTSRPGSSDASPGENSFLGDTVIIRSGGGLGYSFNYLFMISYNFADFGNTLNFMYTMKGTYDLPRMSSSDSANAALSFTHILDSNPTLTVNGSYIRLGTQQSKVRNRVSFSSELHIGLSNVEIDKTSKLIQSGTATVSLSGRDSNGNSFSWTGTITFTGNERATLLLNGKTFALDLLKGEASPG